MNDYLIDFKNMDWENIAPELRCKIVMEKVPGREL